MEWLNYHHLLYFRAVAREGGVAGAARKLGVAHPTVSAQVHALEAELGEALFTREGRGLALTEVGRVVLGYADEIFGLGQELLDTVRGRPTGQPLRLAVGVADAVPKPVARALIAPALRLPIEVRIQCREDKPDRLLEDLALHRLDVVLSDAPVPPGARVRAYSHLLGESGITFFATPALAARHRPTFPASLDGAALLMPAHTANLRRGLDQWLSERGLRPRIVGEFDDTALLEVFGRDGVGLFPGPTALEATIEAREQVQRVGRAEGLAERYYAISVERRVKNPAVLAIQAAARDTLGRG
jgi:LysR family transcriptional activator of nhaA